MSAEDTETQAAAWLAREDRGLTAAERQECYGHLARWAAGRVVPVAYRALSRAKMGNRPPVNAEPTAAGRAAVSVGALVAGQEGKAP